MTSISSYEQTLDNIGGFYSTHQRTCKICLEIRDLNFLMKLKKPLYGIRKSNIYFFIVDIKKYETLELNIILKPTWKILLK